MSPHIRALKNVLQHFLMNIGQKLISHEVFDNSLALLDILTFTELKD